MEGSEAVTVAQTPGPSTGSVHAGLAFAQPAVAGGPNEDDIRLAEWLLLQWDEGRGISKSQLQLRVWGGESSHGRKFVAAAVAGGTVAARGASVASVAATRAFVEALNVRRPDARRTIAEAATTVGVVVAQAALAAAWGLMRAKRQRNGEQQQEISIKLDVAEAGLDQTKWNVDVLRGLMPRATEILEHTSVHAARALDRWEAQLGQGPRQWKYLGEAERQRYRDFVEITAAQYAVAAIDFENLLKSRDDELSRGIAHADNVLAQSRKLVWSLV